MQEGHLPAGVVQQATTNLRFHTLLSPILPDSCTPSTLLSINMKRQSASSSGVAGGEKRNRHSSRTTVLSKAFRVVDAETRQEVRNKRIQQLEADNYGDVDGQSASTGQDDEAYQDNSEDDEANKKKKKKVKQQQKVLPLGGAGGSTKRSTRKVRSLERIIMEQGYQYHLQPPASSGKLTAKQTEKKRSSFSAATTVITIKDEDEEEGGGETDLMGRDEDQRMDVDDDEDYGSSSSSSSSRRNHRGMKSAGKMSSHQGKGSSSTSLEQDDDDEVEIVENPFVYPNTLSIAAAPSTRPPRHFCSVCGYLGQYTCTRCGMRYCCIKCQANHKETRCMKFGSFN